MIDVICRWCGKVIGRKEGDDPQAHGTSSICPECFERVVQPSEVMP